MKQEKLGNFMSQIILASLDGMGRRIYKYDKMLELNKRKSEESETGQSR